MAEQVWRPYWERAGENLRAAETLLRSEPPLSNAATSRAYYAAFHAAIALLLARTEYRPKGQEWAHDQVQAQLNIYCIRRRKLLDAKYGPMLLYLLNHRRSADYLPRGVSRRKAEEALRLATGFLTAIQPLLEEQT
jgi:uncharacterized protein (UPF0332 family)